MESRPGDRCSSRERARPTGAKSAKRRNDQQESTAVKIRQERQVAPVGRNLTYRGESPCCGGESPCCCPVSGGGVGQGARGAP